MYIGLNAHLLSARAGYRSAGIHQYIDHLLRALPSVVPPDWQLCALVGAANHSGYTGIQMQRAAFDTESPLKRIVWEQVFQPWSLSRFDLYHALAFVAPVLLPAAMIVTLYDLSFIHYPERLPAARRMYLERMTRLTCQRARRVIAISHSTARDAAATLGVPTDKIDIAQPGCDFARFRPLLPEQVRAFRQAHDLPERFWLFVGTLEPRKNLTMLLEAYAALSPADRLPLVLAGGKGWDYEPIFEAVERLGLSRSVLFPGFLSADVLPLWYNAAEVFLYPSIFEGFGIPVLEAMACGAPVIVSDASSLPEVAGDAGLCLPPDDTPAWSQALRRAAHDGLWRTKAQERGLTHARRFSWQATASATLASYRRALTD
jgi:glycosyltransferase involved in cell wall biosynthesis